METRRPTGVERLDHPRRISPASRDAARTAAPENAERVPRVTFVSHASDLGGAERSLVDLARGLTRAGVEVRAILPGPGELAEALAALAVESDACPALGRLRRASPGPRVVRDAVRLARGQFAVHGCVRRRPPDVLHANSSTAALFCLRSAFGGRSALVWHVRDLAPLGGWRRPLARASARVVAISSSVEEALRRRVGARVVQVTNGLTLAGFGAASAADSRARLSLGERPCVLSVGQLVPWKGFGRLAEVAQDVLRRCPDTLFLVAGREPEGSEAFAARLRDECAVAVGDAVRWLGRREDVADLMAAADLLLHPAFPEPFGRVVVEAMASRLPVVALGGAHGPAQLLRDGVDGCLVQPHTAPALAEAVVELLGDPERRASMGREARGRALERFGDAAMTRGMLGVYRDVCPELVWRDPESGVDVR